MTDQKVENQTKRRDKILNKMQERASEDQIPWIKSKLEKMKRGAIEDVWPNVQALWKLILDPNAAKRSKLMAIGSLVYLVSPIDAIPDVIPVLGLSDDAAVIVATFTSLMAELGPYVKKKVQHVAGEIAEEASRAAAEPQVRAHATMIKMSLMGAVAIALLAITLKVLWKYLL